MAMLYILIHLATCILLLLLLLRVLLLDLLQLSTMAHMLDLGTHRNLTLEGANVDQHPHLLAHAQGNQLKLRTALIKSALLNP